MSSYSDSIIEPENTHLPFLIYMRNSRFLKAVTLVEYFSVFEMSLTANII